MKLINTESDILNPKTPITLEKIMPQWIGINDESRAFLQSQVESVFKSEQVNDLTDQERKLIIFLQIKLPKMSAVSYKQLYLLDAIIKRLKVKAEAKAKEDKPLFEDQV